jgi:hypothetical protein
LFLLRIAALWRCIAIEPWWQLAHISFHCGTVGSCIKTKKHLTKPRTCIFKSAFSPRFRTGANTIQGA